MIDLGLSDDQRQIVDGVVALLQENCPVSRLRPSAAPSDVHRRLAEWGWFGAALPEHDGGLGLGVAEEVLLYFEAGRFLLSPSVLATTLAARLTGGDERKALCAGDRRAALVLSLGGDEAYCIDGAGAQVLIAIRTDEIVILPAEAFSGEPVVGLDETVALERGRLDHGLRRGGERTHVGVLLGAAMLAGVSRAVCDLAVDYAKVREQFGQPIGAFQAIKHLCADMGLNAYAAEAQVKAAAAAAASTPRDAAFQIAAAAATAMAAARANGSIAIQVHGGIGFTAEADVHVYLKRAHLLSGVLGGLEEQHRWLLNCPPPQMA